MNGFEVYKVYLAIKLHFTSKNQSYDYHRHAGKTTARLATFTKRRDRYFFHKLSRTYSDTNIADYFVSNFIANTNLWVGDIIGKSGDENYKSWSRRIESLHYYYEQDIEYTKGVSNATIRLGYSKIAHPIAYQIMEQTKFGKLCAKIAKPFVIMTSSIAADKKYPLLTKLLGYGLVYPSLFISGLLNKRGI